MADGDLREAERRIEAAARAGAAVLDLGDLGLRRLPGSLAGLPRLRVLALGRAAPTQAEHGLDWEVLWDRPDPSLEDLGPLAGLASLSSLSLSVCLKVSDLGPLAGLASLSSLDLRGCW